jgi:hypothetical protein
LRLPQHRRHDRGYPGHPRGAALEPPDNLHYGAFDFDGTGKFLGKQTALRDKVAIQRENLSGTYTLDANCTGTKTLEGQKGGTAHWDA